MMKLTVMMVVLSWDRARESQRQRTIRTLLAERDTLGIMGQSFIAIYIGNYCDCVPFKSVFNTVAITNIIIICISLNHFIDMIFKTEPFYTSLGTGRKFNISGNKICRAN